jgi:membrane protease YdiL (CAAX protease family)
MRDSGTGGIGFWKTVKLLLGAASKRAAGRRKRQQQLLQNRSTNKAADWSWVQFGVAVLITTIPNVVAPFVVSSAVESGQRLAVERQGKIAVDGWFLLGVLDSSLSGPVVISDGTVSGDTVSFTVVADRGSRIVSFTGRVDGDRMAFTRSVNVRSGADPGEDGIYGASGATSFVAGRVDATRGVYGVWVATDVGHAPWVMTLWADGSTLGGTVCQGGSELASNNIEAWRKALDSLYASEAKQMARRQGGTTSEIEQRLRTEVDINGSRNLVAERAEPGLAGLLKSGPIPAVAGSLVLLWWLAMLVCQGEGLELDLQRRRYPMWEWLFSHPVRPGPVFLAEMLSPIAANPIYWSAPLFVGVLYGMVYGVSAGIAAIPLVGVPVALSAAFAGKALQIAAMLRLSPRSRGAALGIMSWFGYASMMLLLFALPVVPSVVSVMGRTVTGLAVVPWPWLAWFLGGNPGGQFTFLRGVLVCWFASGCVAAVAVWFSAWSADKGLSGNFAGAAPAAPGTRPAKFGRDPLYRKELLWFLRDRSAVVQAILVPLTLAGFWAFNLRRVLSYAQGEWNYFCGAAIFFGTYFLLVLGPKSLASEGAALWITLTWPRGPENLLKAKARLWSTLSMGLVALVLGYACFVFPHDIWKVALVGVGWFFFSISMAEKSVTLVTATPESGEAQKVPAGRTWAVQLGMLTFAIGVITQQWLLAVRGVVYSYITAAAMWQNFRARLPYLYDPWSERVPPPPTLMHAMIGVSILVDCGAAIFGIVLAIAGREGIAMAQSIGYGVAALIVFAGMSNFLSNRGVAAKEIWSWRRDEAPQDDGEGWFQRWFAGSARGVGWLLFGAGAGLTLGLFAHLYTIVLQHIPSIAEAIQKSQQEMARVQNLRVWSAIMAVGFAPFAEEYLFRGLLFRALDREWGGWRAVAGGAAFFAIYHPPLAWLPVGLVGALNCLVFKKSGKLAPAVLLHMIYNGVVVATG